MADSTTDSVVAAQRERERLAAKESVRVFEPKSVAVVGASRREGSIGRAIVDNLKKAGFAGPIYPVNPAATELLGLPSFPSLSAIPGPVDLVVIVVPAEHVEQVAIDSAAVHARGLVVISSGFAEVSAEGRAREVRLRELVRSSGMRMVGPNCMGVLNTSPRVSLNATFCPVWPPPGNVAMLSQSGALGIAIIDYARQLNIGISGFVSVGNKADVSGNDLLSYWADDPETKVIALYLESFGNARRFARLAPQVARRKPIVAVKSGRSAAGTRAASSHSAALASLDVGIDALFEHAGVIRATTLEEMFDVVSLLSTQPLPRGPRVGVVTNAGGPGILLADACDAHGLELPTLSPETIARLKDILPAQAGLSNPIDMIASATPEQYERTLGIVGSDPNVDAVVAIYIPPLVSEPESIARAIARGAAALPADKPLATVFMSSKGSPAALSAGPRGKIPSFSFPENAALALSAAVRHARFRQRPLGSVATIDGTARERIRAILNDALRASTEGHSWLEAPQVSDLLGAAGIPCARSATVAVAPDAAARAAETIGYPIVLKAVADGLVHKTEAGGVVLDLESSGAVRDAVETMKRRVEGAGFQLRQLLVQQQASDGIEGMIGVTTDPGLGPIVVAGIGGVQVELLRDVAFRLPPVSDIDAREMVESLKMKKLFEGFRGARPGDRQAFEDVICRVSALLEIAPEISELDLNPIKIRAPGEGVIVVDARVRLARG